VTLAAAQSFVFVTVDRNLSLQKYLVSPPISVIVLYAKTNRLADLRPPAPSLLTVIENAQPEVARVIGSTDWRAAA
jgi:hypothetical protein